MNERWAVIAPLYVRHSDWLAMASKIVGSADAEDIVHEAYLRVARAKRVGDAEPLMSRTIRNLGIDRLRARRDVPIEPSAMTGVLDAVRPLTIEGAMFVADFNDALAALSDEQAQAFILIQLRGLTQTEAADVLGVSQQAVSKNYERGRRALAGALQ